MTGQMNVGGTGLSPNDAYSSILEGQLQQSAISQTQARAPSSKNKILNIARKHPLRILLAEDNLVNQSVHTRLSVKRAVH